MGFLISFDIEPEGVHCTDLGNFKKSNNEEKLRDTIREYFFWGTTVDLENI